MQVIGRLAWNKVSSKIDVTQSKQKFSLSPSANSKIFYNWKIFILAIPPQNVQDAEATSSVAAAKR